MIIDLIKAINKLLERETFKNIYNNFFRETLGNKTIKLSISDLGQELYIFCQNDSIRISKENTILQMRPP